MRAGDVHAGERERAVGERPARAEGEAPAGAVRVRTRKQRSRSSRARGLHRVRRSANSSAWLLSDSHYRQRFPLGYPSVLAIACSSSSDSVRPADGSLLVMLLCGPPGTAAPRQPCPCDQDERSTHRPPMNRMRRPTTLATSRIYIMPGSFFSFPSTDLLKAHPHNNILENLFLS